MYHPLLGCFTFAFEMAYFTFLKDIKPLISSLSYFLAYDTNGGLSNFPTSIM
jgi:hypothetical protein